MTKLPFPERVLHQHIAVLGKTGSGKSSVLRVIAEHLLDKSKRIFVIDPKGDWWGLKSSADGKSAGYPVIAFGDFKEPRATDVPINQASGKHVAELIATGNRPCIIGFRGWMPGQMTKFWLDFAPALFNLNEGELYGFISEIHNFAPKGKIMDPDSGKMLHWTNRIMSEGRGIGLTFFLDSQRSQKVHNDTLDNCETLVAMRVTHPAARQSIKDWIDGNGDPKVGKEVLETLASLVRGEAWVWSPETDFGPTRVQFPMFQTFDSFAPPQLQKKVSQAGWSEVNLDQVREKLASVIAEAKANDPKELKAEITKLRLELAKKQVPTPHAVPVPDTKLIDRAVRAATAPLLKRLKELHAAAQKTISAITQATHPLVMAAANPIEEPAIPQAVNPTSTPPAPVRMQTPTPRTAPAPVSTNGHGDLSGPQLQMLQRLAEFHASGRDDVRLAWLAASLGTTMRSRGFEANLSTVRRLGHVIVSNERAKLTASGNALCGPVYAPSDVKAKVKEMLSGPQSQLLDVLDSAYPAGMPLEDLAATQQTTPRARGFEANISFLRNNEIIEVSHGEAKRAEWVA